MALPKRLRLTKEKEFETVFKNGRKFVSKYFIVYYYISDNTDIGQKFGVIASKKIGGAVKRNRAKRLIQEVLRQEFEKFRNNIWIIVITRQKILEVKPEILRNELKEIRAIYK